MANSTNYSAFVIVVIRLLLMFVVHLASASTGDIQSEGLHETRINTPGEGIEPGTHETRMASLRRMARQSSRGNGNALIDEVIPTWKAYLRENGYDPLYIKAFDFPLENIFNKFSDCDIVGLTSFKRTGDVTVNASESAFAAEANVGLDKLTAKCKVEVRWSIIRAHGSLTADVADFSVEASVIQIRPPPRMTSLRITNQGTIDVEFIGNGLVGSILQWVGQGYLKYQLLKVLDDTERIKGIVNDAISGVDVETAVNLL